MTPTIPPPAHIRIIGIASLVWNSFGASDYIFFEIGHADYLAQFTPAQLEYLTNIPLWVEIGSALAVWSAIVGSLLLWIRSRHAIGAFALSLIGFAVAMIYQYVLNLDKVLELFDRTEAVIFPAVTLVIAIVLFAYAWWMQKAEWLK